MRSSLGATSSTRAHDREAHHNTSHRNIILALPSQEPIKSESLQMQLPYHSYLLALLICPMILTAPILLPARHPLLRHSPSFLPSKHGSPSHHANRKHKRKGKSSHVFPPVLPAVSLISSQERIKGIISPKQQESQQMGKKKKRERKARKIKQKDEMK